MRITRSATASDPAWLDPYDLFVRAVEDEDQDLTAAEHNKNRRALPRNPTAWPRASGDRPPEWRLCRDAAKMFGNESRSARRISKEQRHPPRRDTHCRSAHQVEIEAGKRLSRRARSLSPDRLDRNHRGGRRTILAEIFFTLRDRLRPGAWPASRPSPSRTACSRPIAAKSILQHVTSSGRHAAVAADPEGARRALGVPVIRERIFGQDHAKTLAIWRADSARPGRRYAVGLHTASGGCGSVPRLLRGRVTPEVSTCVRSVFAKSAECPRLAAGLAALAAVLRVAERLGKQTGTSKRWPSIKTSSKRSARTPLIKLKRASELTRGTISARPNMNPGQSVKDRAGKWMILEAEKRGDLKPAGLVVESTAGNNRHWACGGCERARISHADPILETQSQEKKDMLRLCGAELIEVPVLPLRQSEQLSACRAAAGRRSFARPSRTACCSPTSGTISTTPRRITNHRTRDLEQTGGKIDGSICSVRHRRHTGRRQPLSEGKAPGHRQRLRRPAWLPRCTSCSSTAPPNRRRAT